MKFKRFLAESETGSLLGKKIGGKKITADTKNEKWEGNFFCDYENLTSLEGAPTDVSGHFDCSANRLTSLEHAPTSVGGVFYCSDNSFTSLEHAPTSVGGVFYCSDNSFTSLHNVHKFVKQINGTFNCQGNPITSHVLGVLLIKGCRELLFRPDVDAIVNKYLPNTRGMAAVNECQDELIEADLEDFAEL